MSFFHLMFAVDHFKHKIHQFDWKPLFLYLHWTSSLLHVWEQSKKLCSQNTTTGQLWKKCGAFHLEWKCFNSLSIAHGDIVAMIIKKPTHNDMYRMRSICSAHKHILYFEFKTVMTAIIWCGWKPMLHTLARALVHACIEMAIAYVCMHLIVLSSLSRFISVSIVVAIKCRHLSSVYSLCERHTYTHPYPSTTQLISYALSIVHSKRIFAIARPYKGQSNKCQQTKNIHHSIHPFVYTFIHSCFDLSIQFYLTIYPP